MCAVEINEGRPNSDWTIVIRYAGACKARMTAPHINTTGWNSTTIEMNIVSVKNTSSTLEYLCMRYWMEKYAADQ